MTGSYKHLFLCTCPPPQGQGVTCQPSFHCAWEHLGRPSHLPGAPPLCSSPILLCHAQTTHTCWLRMLTDCGARTECFRSALLGTPPRSHPPLFPARDTAREQLEYLCLSKKTCCAPRVLPVLGAQPSSWCLKLSLPSAALVAGKLE